MTVHSRPNAELELADGVGEALSPEANMRSVELAFLQRVSAANRRVATSVLDATKTLACQAAFSPTYASMRNPVFETISKALEHTVPKEVGFGRFRGRK